MKPRLLDLFCGAGGAAKGYQLAGFHVTGVDIKPQPRYCGDEFHQGGALEFCREHGHEFDAIHASPPCQAYCTLTKQGRAQGRASLHPDLIAPVREALISVGIPYAIENVSGSPLKRGSVMLCGSMFGLKVRRHRWFEMEQLAISPPRPSRATRSCGRRWSIRSDLCVRRSTIQRFTSRTAFRVSHRVVSSIASNPP